MPGVARDGDSLSCGASLISGASRTFVNGRLIVRLGDTSTHGGEVTGASPDVYAEGSPVARLGDPFSCPIHGTVSIESASDDVFANG